MNFEKLSILLSNCNCAIFGLPELIWTLTSCSDVDGFSNILFIANAIYDKVTANYPAVGYQFRRLLSPLVKPSMDAYSTQAVSPTHQRSIGQPLGSLIIDFL